jgi:hypothetical protein
MTESNFKKKSISISGLRSISWFDPFFQDGGWFEVNGKDHFVSDGRLLAVQGENPDRFFCFLVHSWVSKEEVEKVLVSLKEERN